MFAFGSIHTQKHTHTHTHTSRVSVCVLFFLLLDVLLRAWRLMLATGYRCSPPIRFGVFFCIIVQRQHEDLPSKCHHCSMSSTGGLLFSPVSSVTHGCDGREVYLISSRSGTWLNSLHFRHFIVLTRGIISRVIGLPKSPQGSVRIIFVLCCADVQSLIHYFNNTWKCQACHNANSQMGHEA